MRHSNSLCLADIIPAPDLSDFLDIKTEDSISCPSTPLANAFESSKLTDESNNEFSTKLSPFPTVTPRELKELIQNPQKYGYSDLIVLDARFDYEFRGGNIIGARNIRSKSQLIGIFNRFKGQNVCIVVHCEFSKNRGPNLVRLFREYDRSVNVYPNLTFNNLFLLEGGYQKFFKECPDMCTGGYIQMRDERFVQSGDLKRSHSFYTHEMLQQRRCTRTRTLPRCLSQSVNDWRSFNKTSFLPPSLQQCAFASSQ